MRSYQRSASVKRERTRKATKEKMILKSSRNKELFYTAEVKQVKLALWRVTQGSYYAKKAGYRLPALIHLKV